MKTSLGIGTFTWPKGERVSDRYGSVYLIKDGQNSLSQRNCLSLINPEASALAGKRGTLFAKVLQTRESTHIGDLFRGIFPSTPEVGQEIKLGDGSFFTEDAPQGGLSVGLRPHVPRDSDWLDPHKLYRCHEQTVELFFDESERAQ